MFSRPSEWRGQFALAWDDGTIEPILFPTSEAALDFWKSNTRSSGQTVAVVVRDVRTDDDLRTRLKVWAESARRSGMRTFEVNTDEILSLLGASNKEGGKS